MTTIERGDCEYCGATDIEMHDPKTLDAAGWASEAKQHNPAGCEWVETRAHTREATGERAGGFEYVVVGEGDDAATFWLDAGETENAKSYMEDQDVSAAPVWRTPVRWDAHHPDAVKTSRRLVP